MRGVSVVPSYLAVLVVLTIAGVIMGGIIAQVFLPLSKQRSYYGKSIEYDFYITQNNVTVTLANKKNYEAKVDVLLIDANRRVLTACNGTIKSSLESSEESGAISLMGLTILPGDIVYITCSAPTRITDVRVYEYGVPSDKRGNAGVGNFTGGTSPGNVGFGLQPIGSYYGLRYRMPVTVISLADYGSDAVVTVTLSPTTLPGDIWNFFNTNVRQDLADVLVVDTNGIPYPTRATRNGDGSVSVFFKLDYLPRGIFRYYLYFGNPSFTGSIPSSGGATILMSQNIGNIITGSVSYPAFVVPEANWIPFSCDGIRHGVYYVREQQDIGDRLPSLSRNFITYAYNPLKNGDSAGIRNLISQALGNLKDFPVGTPNPWPFYSGYNGLNPKTDLGYAPWGVATVVPLPAIRSIAPGTTVTTEIRVASDDGSAVFLVAFRGDQLAGSPVTYFDRLSNAHAPSYWSYGPYRFSISQSLATGTTMYLIVLTQNGILSGNGPGYQDFRFVMWYVEQVS